MLTQDKPKNYYKTKEHLASIKHISHPYLNRNDKVSGRIYFAFGDVHGEFDMMMDALENAGFDILNDDHHIISLGDSFDRGRQNLKGLSIPNVDDFKETISVNFRQPRHIPTGVHRP